jgi:hypothetical protein
MLPQFRGWTIDLRLREFRKVTKTGIKFIPFGSHDGEYLLRAYIRSLPENVAIIIAAEIS